MRIARPLLQLPIRFDADKLAAEVRALPREAWLAHPEQFEGNDGVPLVSPGGANSNAMAGAMAPTEYLERSPYIQTVMAALDSCWGRSRLMGLAAGSVVPEHVDVHYYWRTHLRIHVPVITNPGVRFRAGDLDIHLAAGECWVLDSFFRHSVENRGSENRVHLVLDTVGSPRLFNLMACAGTIEDILVGDVLNDRQLRFERSNFPKIMSPWEVESHIRYVLGWTEPDEPLDRIEAILERFRMAWAGIWAEHEDADSGLPHYRALIAETRQAMIAAGGVDVTLRNGQSLQLAVGHLLFRNAIREDAVRARTRELADGHERRRLG